MKITSVKKNVAKGTHLSIETFHKLNRAKNVSFHMHLLIRRVEHSAMPLLWIPDVFSYINSDISDVLNELKDIGLCERCLKKQNHK